MGLVKQRWIELESRNLNNIPDKNICANHFEDKAINRFIKQNYQDGFCDYCEKNLKVISLENLMGFIMDGISLFYEDAANFMSYNTREGGYLGETYTPDELIQEQVGLYAEPFEIIEDIVDSIEDIAWAQPDLYHDKPNDNLEYAWKHFKNIIKHKSRYLFSSDNTDQPDAFLILKEVGKLISKLNIIKTIPAGAKLYRCRQHDFKTNITEFKDITAPSNKKAIYPNRFSPSGISMFYSAFDVDTAIFETVSRTSKHKKWITIAEFETLEDQIIVDFSQLPKIPSIFEIKNKKRYYLILFLHSFVRDITQQIIKDGKEHTEYVPTQVVTEFLRFPFNKNRSNKIMGIIYPSSQNKGSKSSVFFWDDELSKERVKLNSIKRKKII
jgi:hypothetical protein